MPFLPRNNDERLWTTLCRSPEHNPPGMISLPAGKHCWICPSCSHKTTFYVAGHFLQSSPERFTQIVPGGIMPSDYNTITSIRITP
jgi:hypothetical protein